MWKKQFKFEFQLSIDLDSRKLYDLTFSFKFDLQNDLLAMTFTYNHFENKCNQYICCENPTVDTEIDKIGLWTPEICHFHYSIGGHLGSDLK